MLNDSYMMGGEMHCMRLGWGRREEIIGDHGFSIRSLRVKTLRVELGHKSDGKKKNDDEKNIKTVKNGVNGVLANNTCVRYRCTVVFFFFPSTGGGLRS